nr:MAG TPA: hypothetical protein [Caudoviricetes sp.]
MPIILRRFSFFHCSLISFCISSTIFRRVYYLFYITSHIKRSARTT